MEYISDESDYCRWKEFRANARGGYMTIYTATVEGVYRHEILGVFTSAQNAVDRASIYLIDEQEDCYHSVDIRSYSIDKNEDDDGILVCKLESLGIKRVHGVGLVGTKQIIFEYK